MKAKTTFVCFRSCGLYYDLTTCRRKPWDKIIGQAMAEQHDNRGFVESLEASSSHNAVRLFIANHIHSLKLTGRILLHGATRTPKGNEKVFQPSYSGASCFL